MNVLVIEDDAPSAKQLIKVLQSEKYKVDWADGYYCAIEFIDKSSYSIILLDWNLGDGDGLMLVKYLRDMDIQTPILMLSANSDVDGKVSILNSGADDYLCKPYSNIEMLARMRALLRRDVKEKKTNLSIDNVKLNLISRELYVDDTEVKLTQSEFDILEVLMQNTNTVLTRYQLNEHINKDNYVTRNSNIIDVHIKNLRKKLNNKDFIQTIRGVGYKINKSS